MTKYTSGRQKNLKVGISSYSENLTSLEVIGNVGIGSTQVPNGVRLAVGAVHITDTEITANRFIGTATSLDINGLPLINDPKGGDFIALYDVSGTVVGKSTIQDATPQGINVLYNNINIGTGVTNLVFAGTGISSVTANLSGFSTITVDLQSNLDGGAPTTNYGGIEAIEGGNV